MSLAVVLGKLFLLVLLMALPALSPPVASAAETPKKVLIFSGSDPNLPSVILVNQILREALEKGVPGRVQFYSEALDNHRIPEDKYEQEIIKYLQRKYEGEKFDLIFSLTSPALKFLLKHKDELFSNTPKIFLNTNEREGDGLDLGQNVTGVQGRIELKPALDLALSLHPGTRRVVVVTGNSGQDKFWEALAHSVFRSYENRVEFTYLTNTTIEELRKELSSLPPNTIVFFLLFVLDREGNGYSFPEAVSLVAPSSSAPVYVAIQSGFRQGVVGGRMISYEALGKAAAEMGLRVLAGERPQDIPPQTVESVAMFDWRELRRWGISESKLPPGSIVRFKEPTLWEQYKWHIIGIISLCIIEALLIAWLLFASAKRRRAEKESERFARLAEDEHRHLNEVVSNTPGVVWESRFESATSVRKIEFVNDYVEQMLGYSVEECLATENFWLSIIHEDDREESARNVDMILEGGQAGVQQFRCMTKDGRVLWVEAHLAAIRDKAGKPVGLRGVAMDISDRKDAEEALLQSEARFRHMADTAPVLIWMSNTNMHVSYVNQRCLDFTGRSTEELLGEGWLDLVHEDYGQRYVDIYTAAYERREPFVYEYRIRHADGEFHWLYSTSDPRFASDGEFLGYIGSCVDITDRKLAEDAVRESEARFRHMADSSPVMIWIADTNMHCTFFNQKVIDFTGRSMEELCGEGWLEIVHEDDRQRCVDAYNFGYERREPFVLDYRIRRVDGEFRWIYDTGAPRFASNGELIGYIGSAVDITDRKAAEEALQIAHDEVNQLKNKLEEENIYLQEEIRLEHNFGEIVGQSDAIKYVLYKIEQVAPTDSTVLICGETGTGKELVARAIHSTGRRKDRPLVKVNCAALSASLIESELFGHERGAFTGAAARKIGRFELATGATIFLDEIGELPLELQVKLLRVIQEGEFERLGSSKTIRADVRIIAATNRNLQTEVQRGFFREDLFYRLNVFPITVPPLKQRREDIPLLIEHFAMRFSKKLGKEITSVSPSTLKSLREYSWPGNIRELANVIERAIINTQGKVLRVVDHLETFQAEDSQNKTLEEMERSYIIDILGDAEWRIEGPNGAARILGLNPSTLRTRMAKLGIKKPNPNLASASERR